VVGALAAQFLDFPRFSSISSKSTFNCGRRSLDPCIFGESQMLFQSIQNFLPLRVVLHIFEKLLLEKYSLGLHVMWVHLHRNDELSENL